MQLYDLIIILFIGAAAAIGIVAVILMIVYRLGFVYFKDNCKPYNGNLAFENNQNDHDAAFAKMEEFSQRHDKAASEFKTTSSYHSETAPFEPDPFAEQRRLMQQDDMVRNMQLQSMITTQLTQENINNGH